MRFIVAMSCSFLSGSMFALRLSLYISYDNTDLVGCHYTCGIKAAKIAYRSKRLESTNRAMVIAAMNANVLRLLANVKHTCYTHALAGNYIGFRKCHIQPDWLLKEAVPLRIHSHNIRRSACPRSYNIFPIIKYIPPTIAATIAAPRTHTIARNDLFFNTCIQVCT